MALQQIYWEQIATEDITSGQTVNLGNPTASISNIYTENIVLNGQELSSYIGDNLFALEQFTSSVSQSLEFTGSNMTVKGDLNVLGAFTSIKSETVTLDDNIIELNGSEESFGGLLIKDPTQPNLVSGSLLWDTTNDEWIAGPQGGEVAIARKDHLIWGDSGSFWSANSDLQVTGSVVIKGDLRVEGQTTMVSQDINQDSLVISGAMSILKNELDAQIRQASLTIENLGSIGDRLNNSIMDLGGF
jgi:hypothetical protein